MIFNQYLPESMITSLNEKLGEKEREEIEQLKKDLEAQNQARLEEMKAEEALLAAALKKQQSELSDLGDLEKQLKAREDRRRKFDEKEKTMKDDRQKATDEMNKMREAIDKGLDVI